MTMMMTQLGEQIGPLQYYGKSCLSIKLLCQRLCLFKVIAEPTNMIKQSPTRICAGPTAVSKVQLLWYTLRSSYFIL